MFIKIVLFMILFHIIDDFVLQPICLSKLKQKCWWNACCSSNEKYQTDYKCGLVMSAVSWSIMVHIPILIVFPLVNEFILFGSILVNMIIHYYCDDLKVNKFKIDFTKDQFIRIMQIIVTANLFMALSIFL